MAGEGARFKEVGYPLPKPFIEIGDKHILEWTTRSLPFIEHYGEKAKGGLTPTVLREGISLHFAIRTEHEEKFQIVARLKKIYGEHITIKLFEKLTRGNLETAYLACKDIKNNEQTLILDSDNHYDGSNLLNFLRMYEGKYPHFGAICYFDPLDNSHKWCFAIPKGNRVENLMEKDERAIAMGGKPMVGVFYFNNKDLFMDTANYVLHQNEKVRGEFFMSQSIQCLIDNGIPIFGLKVTNVKPLGTPGDIMKTGEKEYENLY